MTDHDHLADLGIKMAMQINREVSGPHDAISVLAVVMARVLCEFPKDRWDEVLEAFSTMAMETSDNINEMLIRNKDLQ